MGYQENKIAQVLAKGQTEFIGIIIPNLYFHYYSAILNQILTSYSDNHYKFLVFLGDDDIEVERQYIQELQAYNIQGLITLSHTIPSEELASYNIPIVSIEREAQFISSVNADNYLGGVQATSHLIKTIVIFSFTSITSSMRASLLMVVSLDLKPFLAIATFLIKSIKKTLVATTAQSVKVSLVYLKKSIKTTLANAKEFS